MLYSYAMNKLFGKKILFVITKSNWGGAQSYAYTLPTAAAAVGASVAVAFGGTGVAGAPTGLLAERLHEKRIRTIFIPSFARDVSFLRDAKAFFELVRVCRTERPDVLHLNSSKAGGLGALAGRIARVPKIVFTVHGWPFAENRNVLWRLFAFLGSWATALLSDAVIVISTIDLQRGLRLPFCSHKTHLIYNGIDLSMQFDSGERIRSAFPPGVHITGTVGELTQNKNHISLVERARHEPNLYVAIVGEGEERTHLEAKIKEYNLDGRVKLFGFIPSCEVLRGFDTFVLPSLKEGLPYVLLEARMAGLPIVANRVGGVGDVLDARDLSAFSLEQMVEKTVALYLT